jgi:hypothetical protein
VRHRRAHGDRQAGPKPLRGGSTRARGKSGRTRGGVALLCAIAASGCGGAPPLDEEWQVEGQIEFEMATALEALEMGPSRWYMEVGCLIEARAVECDVDVPRQRTPHSDTPQRELSASYRVQRCGERSWRAVLLSEDGDLPERLQHGDPSDCR